MTDKILADEMRAKNNPLIRDQVNGLCEEAFYEFSKELRETGIVARLLRECYTVDQLVKAEKARLINIARKYEIKLGCDAEIAAFKVEFGNRLLKTEVYLA